jgi:hypothetical protein
MGALVSVGDSMPACVCVPRGRAAGASEQGSAAVSGAAVVIAQQHAQQQAQQAQQAHVR